MKIKPVIYGMSGAAGRMGRRIIATAAESPEKFKLAVALDRPESEDIGKDAGVQAGVEPQHVLVTSALADIVPQVIIDFSAPDNSRNLINECVSRHIALLVGTTGLNETDQLAIDEAARHIAILQATNTSLGINVLLRLVAEAAKQLGSDYDIEIIEAHHNQKKDAPSGTAMSLAESIAAATKRDIATDLVHGRHGLDAKRKPGTIGMHAVRMGDVIGEHTVYFAATGERVEVKHIASTRDTFARGALRAAMFLAKQKPGRYTMADVLGL